MMGREGGPTVYVCAEHRVKARDTNMCLPLDKRVTLKVLYPRRYGGGAGVGQVDQLPLQLCIFCAERAGSPDGERSEQ